MYETGLNGMSIEEGGRPARVLGLVDRVHQLLTEELEPGMAGEESKTIPSRSSLEGMAKDLMRAQQEILSEDDEAAVIRGAVDRILGLGPLQPLLEDSGINEIMVNDAENVFIEREGRLFRTGVQFRDEKHLRHIIDRIVAPLGRRIDESSPLVDARLPDGSRVNAIIPPLALRGPALTIRKFAKEPFTLDRLVDLGTVHPAMGRFLARCVRQRISLIISGGTGAGKTSTLNALGLCIPEGERLISIEDSAELQLRHPHWVSLESRPPNLEGQGEIPIRALVRNALRMRPDRIIVGEVRGGEAFDMLQAMNTGHRGSLTTLHANSPQDALVRLESMVLMAGFEMPVSAIRRMIGGAVELVLQQERIKDGKRVMTAVFALQRPSPDTLDLRPLFRFRPDKGKFSQFGEGEAFSS